MAKYAVIAETVATITDRGQTTVPAAIRRKLALGKRDRVVFRELSDGSVMIAKQHEAVEHHDPILSVFLAVLEKDIGQHPDRLRNVPRSLIDRARALVDGVEVDLDERLADDEA